jgi:hypothetical protein
VGHLFENSKDFAVDFCSSTCWFSQGFSAYVTGDFVDCVAEEELFVAAFVAFYAEEDTFWFGDELVPFRHFFLLHFVLLYDEFS